MATITGSGTLGNWSAVGSWVGGVPPTAADDVLLTAASVGTLVIDGTSGAPNLCRSLDCTGFVGTITQASLAQLNIGDGTTGAFKLVAGMTYAPNAGGILKFVSTSGGICDITTAAKRICALTFDGVGGSWRFLDAVDPVASAAPGITLTNGALNTNGQTVGNSSGVIFSSNNSNTRSMTMGATNWKTGITGSLPIGWDIGTTTGITLSAASSTITIPETTTTTMIFNGGGLTYGTVTATALTTGTVTMKGSNTYATLTLSMGATAKVIASGYAMEAGKTSTVTGTFTAAGNTALLRNFIYSATMGTTHTISASTVTVTNADLRDITGTGAGSWNFSGLTANANGNAGGNTGITFTAPKSCFMKTAVSVSWSANNWYTTTGGAVHIVPALPLVHDNVFFDANSVTAGSVTITVDECRLPSLDWSNVANTPVFAHAAIIVEYYGNIILVSGMTHTGTGVCQLVGRGSFSFDSGTLSWPASSNMTVNCINGTYTLARNLTSLATLTCTTGTFSTGTFTITFTTLTMSGGTLTLGGNATMAGAFTGTSGTINLSTFNIASNTTMVFQGLTITGTGTISGTTITFSGAAVTMNGPGCTISGSTITVNGSGSTYNVGKVTGTGALTATTGTVNMYGNMTVSTSVILSPKNGGAFNF